MFTVRAPEDRKMATENDLDELADMISAAIEKASQLDMHTSAYILSMALAEVSKATKAARKPDDGKTS
jgi:hypothetical protein